MLEISSTSRNLDLIQKKGHQVILKPQGAIPMEHSEVPKRIVSAQLIVGLAILLAMLLVSVPSALSADNHACDFITKEEVEQLIGTGVSIAQPQASNPMGQNICVFDIPESKGLGLVQVQMLRTKWAKQAGKGGLTAPSLFENSMSYLDNLKEIEGLGEKAYWGGTGIKMGAGLHVLYKDTFMTIGVEVGDTEVSLEKARELAAIILQKLN